MERGEGVDDVGRNELSSLNHDRIGPKQNHFLSFWGWLGEGAAHVLVR